MLFIGSGAPRLDPAPAHVVAQRSGHLAQRVLAGRTPGRRPPWVRGPRRRDAALRAASGLSRPSIRGVEPPTSADWKGRNRRTRSIRRRAFLSCARRSGAAITRSLLNLFRATDATGRGSRPEVRSGPGTPRATHNQPGTPPSLLLRDHDGAGSLARVRQSLLQPELRRAAERRRSLRLRGPRADRGGRRDHLRLCHAEHSIEHFPSRCLCGSDTCRGSVTRLEGSSRRAKGGLPGAGRALPAADRPRDRLLLAGSEETAVQPWGLTSRRMLPPCGRS
jgi:hypothetical protein